MNDSCCGGCGGQDAQPKKEKTGVQQQVPEQEQNQAQKQDKAETKE
jgi:hypothetical protein